MSIKRVSHSIFAVLILSGFTAHAATLEFNSRVLVSENNQNFNLSVFPGAAGYDNTGTLVTNPPLLTGTFGDGTVSDYKFFHSPAETIVPYASGPAGRISDVVSAAENINGSGENWANVWTATDPGAGFSTAKDFINGSVPNTFARSAEVDGAIDISGLVAGTVYIPHGTFNNGWTLTLTMQGVGQPDIVATDSNGGIGSNNQGYISDFIFDNASSLYDTIVYNYTHGDRDGSRARFMGVILEVAPIAASPPTVVNVGATDIEPISATLSGNVTETGGVDPTVILYWGDNDGGTTPGNWDNAVPLGAQVGIFSTGLSGLTPATAYFYRWFASNNAGDVWTQPTAEFSTGAPPDPPSVVVTSASDVTFTTARMNGAVTSTGGETPNVTLYYGDNDGGATAGNWDDSVVIGAHSGAFTNELFGLTHDTTYYYRAFAQNSGGTAWSPTSTNFTTLAYGLPGVTNTAAANITGTAAQVGGEVLETGGNAPAVTIYWGPVDGGTNVGSWAESVELGTQVADFTTVLSGLNPLSTYYFRARAQNAAGESWVDASQSFTTLEVSELVINEFMAANDGGNTNNDNSWYPITNQVIGTSYDWIEILNTGANPLNLDGWHLTNDAGNLTQWTFPTNTVLAAGAYMIVYASSSNAPDANGNLHTSFKLAAGGEYIALVRPSGTVASAFGPGGSDYPKQSDDVSYGLHPNTSESVYFSSPTPGTANDPAGLARVADTRFSPDRGYYQAATNVTIVTDTPGAIIYYTTDGMPPVDVNGNPTTTAIMYSGPIPIAQTTPIRAAAVKAGFAPTNIDAHTYILLDIDNANPDGTDAAGLNTSFIQQTQPPGWGNLSGGDFNMDPDVTRSTALATGHATTTAQTMLQGLRDIPTISIVMNRDDFSGTSGVYYRSGDANLEKACSAEFIPATGDTRKDWQINCGIKVQGGASRGTQYGKHSLNLRFRREYGEGRLRQALFPGSEVEEFNSVAFRAGYNNSWIHWSAGQRARGSMIRDQWMRESMLDMGNPAAGHGFMVHIFVNGLYWGVHNMVERPEASHYAAHNGGDDNLLDANNGGSPTDGNSTAFTAMKNMVANTGTPDYWSKVQGVIDIDHYIDYQIINRYGGNGDLKGNGNWRSAGGGPFPAGQPELMAPWQLYSWDGERTLETRTASNSPIDPFGVRGTLEGNTEYRMRFADRLQKHFFHGGALTAAACKARWKKYADDLDRAIIAESARWGDHQRNPPYTRDVEWLTEQNRLYTDYFIDVGGTDRSDIVFNNYSSLFPNTDAPVFEVNGSPQHGGEIPGGGTLSITATSGTIYYTLDGSDPRLEGGAVNTGSAVEISSGTTVSLPASGLVRMRARNGGEWSALNEATFYLEPLAVPGDVVVTEIHYNPYPANALEQVAGAALPIPRVFNNRDDFEFIELRNISGHAINLDGAVFTTGISYAFGVRTVPADGHVVLVKDAEAFTVRHAPVTEAGTYDGNLDDSGERLVLQAANGATLLNFRYDSSGAWPGRPNGNGSSLELIDPLASLDDSDNWRPSREFNGSPGNVGNGPDNRVVINEVASHTDLPERDAIELHNTTTGMINVAGWVLSDNNAFYPSFMLPATNLAAGGYVAFDADDFDPAITNVIVDYTGTLAAAPTTVTIPGHGLATGELITIVGYPGLSDFNDSFQVTVVDADHITIDTPLLDNAATKGTWVKGRPFALSASRGEDLWLLETDLDGQPLSFVDRVDFAAAFNGETLGRWPDGAGTGTLIPMVTNTLGTVNLGARIGPVIISEVMYQPDAPAEDLLEYVELCNLGLVPENLAQWRLRGGVDYNFSGLNSLPAHGGLLVVVGFDPLVQTNEAAAFRNTYGIDASVPLVGPFSDGPLGNDRGTVRLQRPDTPPAGDPGFYPQVTEDEVIYEGVLPWPLSAAGGGDSLNRAGIGLFGNFASSWIGAGPSPGGKRLNYETWATLNFGAGNPPGSGPFEDFDLDGLLNVMEYALGFDPRVANPKASLNPAVMGNAFTLDYQKDTLLSDIAYRVEMSVDLENWDPVPDVLVSSANYVELRRASVPVGTHTHLYLRLVISEL